MRPRERLEALTRGTVFDLTPVVAAIEPEEMRRSTEWKRSQDTVDFLLAQIAKPEASIDPPPEEAIRFLEEKSSALDAWSRFSSRTATRMGVRSFRSRE